MLCGRQARVHIHPRDLILYIYIYSRCVTGQERGGERGGETDGGRVSVQVGLRGADVVSGKDTMSEQAGTQVCACAQSGQAAASHFPPSPLPAGLAEGLQPHSYRTLGLAGRLPAMLACEWQHDDDRARVPSCTSGGTSLVVHSSRLTEANVRGPNAGTGARPARN